MLKELSLQEFLLLSQTHQRVAVFREILADRITPISIMESLEEEMKDGAVLESALQRKNAGRFSFLAFGLQGKFCVENHQVEEHINQQMVVTDSDPLDALRHFKNTFACGVRADMGDYITSAMGFMTYDAVRLFENIPDRHKKEAQLPEMQFNFYRNTLMYDHHEQKLLISIISEVTEHPEEVYKKTMEEIQDLARKISTHHSKHHQNFSTPPDVKENDVTTDISDQEFMSLVDRAKKYIVSGDAFQIVISRSFKKKYTVNPLDIYRALRVLSPTPYMFYFPVKNGTIMGASPEKLIGVHDGEVSINPIAGTRRRGVDPDDNAIEEDLLSDPKEISEHMMLVDLARNDLGAVCVPGSVSPSELKQVKHFSHVSHIASVIKGKLDKNKDAFDALRYAFPAGTLSGAPKIRAMEIIDELEVSRRNLYGGAICRLDYKGNLDTCIAIRMAMLKEGVATVRAGAGIVYDSDPLAETQETRHKAQAILDAISLAERGL